MRTFCRKALPEWTPAVMPCTTSLSTVAAPMPMSWIRSEPIVPAPTSTCEMSIERSALSVEADDRLRRRDGECRTGAGSVPCSRLPDLFVRGGTTANQHTRSAPAQCAVSALRPRVLQRSQRLEINHAIAITSPVCEFCHGWDPADALSSPSINARAHRRTRSRASMPSTRHAVLGIMLAAGMSLAVPAPAAAEGVPDEAKIAGRTVAVLPARRRGLFPRDGQWPRADAGRDQGPQHVAGLDRRRRPVLGPPHPRHVRCVRPAQDDLLAPQPEEPSQQSLALSWPDQRALLRRGEGPRSRAFRAVARPAARRLPARPVRRRRRNIRAWRSARAARTCRSAPTMASRPASSACGCSRTRPSTRRQPRSGIPVRFYTDPDYYNDKDLVRPYRVGMSCAFCHVGPSPIAPPADPENPKWENINATVGSQYFWIDRIFAWEANPAQLHVPAGPHPASRHAGHLAGLDRLHQQPAHDERDLQSRPAPRPGQALGRGDAWAGASSTTSSSTTSSTTAR